MRRKQPSRTTLKFQLEFIKDAWLIDWIVTLKSQRKFTRTFREAFRLIRDLRQGKTDVLFELFPWIEESLKQQPDTIVPAQQKMGIADQLQRLEDLIVKQGGVPLKLGGGKAPDALDIKLEVKTSTRSADNNATWNFMISSAINVYGELKGLPQEVIDYGVRTKRIPEKLIPKGVSPSAEVKKGPKKMDVPDIAPPSFDNLTL